MKDLEFYTFLLANWPLFLLINGLTFITLYLCIYKSLIAGIFDPLFLVFIVGFSTNYAAVIFLYINSLISFELFFMVMIFAVVFIIAFVFFSKFKMFGILSKFINYSRRISNGQYEFKIVFVLYLLISLYILSSIGFGIFSETNRFENNRGYGALVRVLDLFSVFIIAFSTLKIKLIQNGRVRIIFWFLLALFVIFSSMINGAKIAIVFSIITIYLVQSISGYQIKVSMMKVIVLLLVGISFMIVALQINLKANNVDTSVSSEHIKDFPLVIERLIHRVVANGNTSYMLLPNDVINKIEKDSAIVRFLAPIISITKMSQVLGYDVGNFSVGRQALLYHYPNQEVAGGPTGHFDLFSYVYFGFWGGLLFVAFLGLLLGVINNEIHRRAIKQERHNIFISALLATIWVRVVIVVVEPTIGLAYLIDLFVIFLFLITFLGLMKQFIRS